MSDYIVNPIKIVPNVRIYLRDGTLYVVQTSNCVSTEKDFRKEYVELRDGSKDSRGYKGEIQWLTQKWKRGFGMPRLEQEMRRP